MAWLSRAGQFKQVIVEKSSQFIKLTTNGLAYTNFHNTKFTSQKKTFCQTMFSKFGSEDVITVMYTMWLVVLFQIFTGSI